MPPCLTAFGLIILITSAAAVTTIGNMKNISNKSCINQIKLLPLQKLKNELFAK